MKVTYKAMSKGKFGPQNRITIQPVVKTKAMAGVKFQEQVRAKTAAEIVLAQKDNTVGSKRSIAMSGVKTSPYRFNNGTKC